MRYLCRLVTPPGGTVLDPDYFEMATERVKNATAQMRLAL
jgi:hypothetical protein